MQIGSLQADVTVTKVKLKIITAATNEHNICIGVLKGVCCHYKNPIHLQLNGDDLLARSRRQNIRVIGVPEGVEN